MDKHFLSLLVLEVLGIQQQIQQAVVEQVQFLGLLLPQVVAVAVRLTHPVKMVWLEVLVVVLVAVVIIPRLFPVKAFLVKVMLVVKITLVVAVIQVAVAVAVQEQLA
jgi:hypothetical protein